MCASEMYNLTAACIVCFFFFANNKFLSPKRISILVNFFFLQNDTEHRTSYANTEQADVRSLPHTWTGVHTSIPLFIHYCCALYCVHTGLTGMPQPISTGPLNTNSNNNNNSATLGDLMPPPSHSLSHEPPVLSHPPFQATAEQ